MTEASRSDHSCDEAVSLDDYRSMKEKLLEEEDAEVGALLRRYFWMGEMPGAPPLTPEIVERFRMKFRMAFDEELVQVPDGDQLYCELGARVAYSIAEQETASQRES